MVVVDTSALIAILFAEADAPVFADRLRHSTESTVSSATFPEAGIVAHRRAGGRDPSGIYRLLEEADIRVERVSQTQARMAIDAYARFGHGSGHSAGLNYGDCFAYALARHLDQPLLFKGDDFARTDIRSAL
jgi:ribonuclease VapC